MTVDDTSLGALLDLVVASEVPARRPMMERLRVSENEAKRRRAGRREAGLPAPALLFLSMRSVCDFSCNRCSAARYPWVAVPGEAATNRALSEAERYGVSYCALTGCRHWLNADLFDVLRTHDRQLFLLIARPEEFDRDTIEQLATVPHVLPLLYAADLESGSGLGLPEAKRAIAGLRSRGVPFGFSVCSNVQSLPCLMCDEFYERAARAGASFGVVLDCMVPRGKGEAFMPLSAEERIGLSAHIARLRKRLGIFLAYLPWEESRAVWCVGAPSLDSGRVGDEPPFELLHVAPAHPSATRAGLPTADTFDRVRVAIMGAEAAAQPVEAAQPPTPAKRTRTRRRSRG